LEKDPDKRAGTASKTDLLTFVGKGASPYFSALDSRSN
jgi:hypothetical protein